MNRLDPNQLNGQALAYLGDAVYEMHIRCHLLEKGKTSPNRLHQAAVRYVSAKAQSSILKAISPILTESEQMMVRRGRNAKLGTVPKNTLLDEYRSSTAFECLLGYLYLMEEKERLGKLISMASDFIEETTEMKES